MRYSSKILLIVALAFVAFVFYSLLRVEPIEISSAKLRHVGGDVVVAGVVENTGPSIKGARLKLRLFDGHGEPVGQREIMLGPLKHGASRKFSSPPIAAPGATEYSVAVDRGTDMYGN